MARGRERQLDREYNPLFYADEPLTSAAYHRWLVDNGVTWVALPDVPLDYSSVQEVALIRSGLPYLHRVWSNPHWTLWRVSNSPGLVTGAARLEVPTPRPARAPHRHEQGAGARAIPLHARGAGHPGSACISRSAGGWLRVEVHAPGTVDLTAHLPRRRPHLRRTLGLRAGRPVAQGAGFSFLAVPLLLPSRRDDRTTRIGS